MTHDDLMREATGRDLLADLHQAIGYASELFRGKQTRFAYYPGDSERKPCLRIILNEELCLWWFKYEDGWRYDGHEVGKYIVDGQVCWLNETL